MNKLLGKKILFISVRFFGYETAIINELEKQGAQVTFYDDRPSNSPIAKALIRLNKKLLAQTINRYYQSILQDIQGQTFDYFLLIKGEAIPKDFITALQKDNPKMISLAHNYDTVQEHPYFREIAHLFHKVSTFDPDDAKTYGWKLRPNFFLEEYHPTHTPSPRWDMVFVGTAHTDRYLIGEQLRHRAAQQNLRALFYYYTPNKVLFTLRRFFDKELKHFDVRKLQSRPLSHTEMREVYTQSKAVVDINKPYQKGLTMRTFEVLASGKKLITFNRDIAQYPFYNENNILILDRDHIVLPPSFFETPFLPLPQALLQTMNLTSWVEDVFTL